MAATAPSTAYDSVKDTADLAKGYTTASSTQTSTGQYLISKLSISASQRVLDVGCGPGNITSDIASIVGSQGHVIGLDPSPERIALAQDLAKSAPNGNLDFFVGYAEDLSKVESGSIDVVFVNSTFHWVQDQPGAIKEFARVLKSGGKLGMSGGSGDFTAIHEKIKELVLSREPYAQYPEQAGPKFIKSADLNRLLDDAGFGQRDIEVKKIVKEAKDGEEMVRWLDTSSSGKTYGGIPVEMREKARGEMVEEWKKHTTEEGIKMNMELLVTVAVKK